MRNNDKEPFLIKVSEYKSTGFINTECNIYDTHIYEFIGIGADYFLNIFPFLISLYRQISYGNCFNTVILICFVISVFILIEEASSF